MEHKLHRRRAALFLPLAAAMLSCWGHAAAQASSANIAAESPAGVAAPTQQASQPVVTSKQAREADDAFLSGARRFDRHDYAAAEIDFARAVSLNPNNPDYVRALAFARESRVSELVHAAASARAAHDTTRADQLLAQAHALDPDNRIVAQHLASGGDAQSPTFDPLRFPANNIASVLGGPVELKPTPGTQDIHLRGDGVSVLRDLYAAFGIRASFDPSAESSGPSIRFDLPGATFAQATSLLHQMTKTFAVAVQPNVALIARDTSDNRERLVPQIEETIYLRGMTAEQMQELANLARNIYEPKAVTASASTGTILVRADERTLRLINAQYADMLDGGSDVLLEITLYELDESKTRNFGVTFPSSISAFPLATELQNALNQNQAAINAAIQSGLFNTTGLTPIQIKLAEVFFLYQYGLLSSSQISQITGLLGTIGNFGGLPLLGVSIASGANVTALLQSSDSRLVDSLQLRSSNAQPASFRSGTRYPIETAQYTSGVSSAASSALAGVTVNGQSAASLLAQYGYGSSSAVTVPQIQFEDLGITLKATPTIQRNDDVRLVLDMKIESLGATALNGIPVLNNRALQSTVTVPAGQTAMLVSHLSRSELRSIQGVPGLNELPGFTGTEHDSQKDTAEVLITITPHIVRQGATHIASRPLLVPHTSGSSD